MSELADHLQRLGVGGPARTAERRDVVTRYSPRTKGIELGNQLGAWRERLIYGNAADLRSFCKR